MIIYKVTNLINGKIYIGKTVLSLDKRKTKHPYHAKINKYNSIFHAAIRKYGIENFKWEVVAKCLFIELEQYYIKLFNSKKPHGYNLTDGGEGLPGFIYSKEMKEKISKSLMGNKRTLGKKHSAETRQKMSDIHKGKTFSEETRKKLSAAMSGEKSVNFGKHLSEEQKKHLSVCNKGKYVSPETRQKIRIAMIGIWKERGATK